MNDKTDEQKPQSRWPVWAVLGIFALVAVVVVYAIGNHEADKLMQFLILAGLVVSFIDRHVRDTTVNTKIDANTAVTVQAAKSAAHADSTVRETKQEAVSAAKSAAQIVAVKAVAVAGQIAEVAATKVAEEAKAAVERTIETVNKIGEQINGRMEQLLAEARAAALAEGKLLGQEEERKRQAKGG